MVLFTDKQKEVLNWYDEYGNEDELTMKLPTGFGKTLIFTHLLKNKNIIVFPTLTLMDQYYKKYFEMICEYSLLFICTENTELRDIQQPDVIQGHDAKKKLAEKMNKYVILTTYVSLPFVLENMLDSVELTIFDEAHHRGDLKPKNKAQTAIDSYRNKLGQILNMTATPSEYCEGEEFNYSLRDAIEDGNLRDFNVHIFVMSRQHQELMESLDKLSQATKNTKSMVFTGLAIAEEEGRTNVTQFVKQYKKQCDDRKFYIDGITSDNKRTERESKIQSFQNFDENSLSLLVSCKTLGEGIDIKNVNSIIFIDPKSSTRDIIQCIGRATRLYRDDNGQPLQNQPFSSVIIPVYIDTEAYSKLQTDDEKDQYIRDITQSENTSFQNIMNVISALKEENYYFDMCINYPNENTKRDSNENEDICNIKQFPKDGNCFFNCIADILSNKTHSEIRQEVVQYLHDNHEQYINYGITCDEIDELRQAGIWNMNAMDLVPRVTADLYNLNLIVENNDENYAFGDENHSVYRLRLQNNHYDRIIEEKDKGDKNKGDKNRGDKNEEKTIKRNHIRKFRGHVSDSVKVLWKFNQVNDYFGSIEHQLIDPLTWEDKLEKLRQWMNENQRKPSTKTAKDEIEKRLGGWIFTQNTHYKKQKYSMKTPEIRAKWDAFKAEYPDYFVMSPTTPISPITPSAVQPPSSKPDKRKCEFIIKRTKMRCKKNAYLNEKYCTQHLKQKPIPTEPEYMVVKKPVQGYHAPNPVTKDEINRILTELCEDLPEGDCIVLDDPEFKTTKSIHRKISSDRIIVPQNDKKSYEEMILHPTYGKCVLYDDLLNIPIHKRVALVYADLMGSIKEAIPILNKFRDNIQRKGILAITVCRRDGETTNFTNEFMAQLCENIGKIYRDTYEIIYKNVYGETKQMGTMIIKLIE